MPIRKPREKQVQLITNLTAHLRGCYECRAVVKGGGDGRMCRDGSMMCLEAARGFTSLVTLHSKAFKHEGQVVYACPDPKRHSLAYQMTAQPMMVTAFQETLF
jgi:hypothetical protein